MLKKIVLAMVVCIVVLSATVCFAEAAQPQHSASDLNGNVPSSHWQGTNASFGFNQTAGNTDTLVFTYGLDVLFEKNRWKNVFKSDYTYGKADSKVNQDVWQASEALEYSFNIPRTTFVFGKASSVYDKFGALSSTWLVASGLGHDIVRNKKVVWTAQAGPGYRFNRVQDTNQTDDNWLLTTQTALQWQMAKGVQFNQTVQADFSSDYNYYTAKTALQATVIKHVAVQASYSLERYSRFPFMVTKKSLWNEVTAISVIYNFV